MKKENRKELATQARIWKISYKTDVHKACWSVVTRLQLSNHEYEPKSSHKASYKETFSNALHGEYTEQTEMSPSVGVYI